MKHQLQQMNPQKQFKSSQTQQKAVTTIRRQITKKKAPKSYSKSVFNLKWKTPHCYREPHNFKVQVAIKGVLIAVTTDTGAQVNILPHHIVKQLNLPIQRSRIKICPYGSRPFSVRGKYEGTVSFGDSIIPSVWYIIKKKAIEPLLSGSTAEQLGIIKFAPSPLTSSDMKYINAINTTTATNDSANWYYIQKYPEAFNGVGTLKDYEFTLHQDPNIKPVAEPSRTIPFHLQECFSNEIKQMEKQGIIEPHTGPAPWISNVVLAPNDDGNIRVTVDMRQVNKAIKSTNLPISKIEYRKAKMAGNKVFFKLDFCSAFHQLHLAEESWYAAVSWWWLSNEMLQTHNGQYGCLWRIKQRVYTDI